MVTKHTVFFLIALLAIHQSALYAAKPKGGAGAALGAGKSITVKLPQIHQGHLKTDKETENRERPDETSPNSAAAKEIKITSATASATPAPTPANSPKDATQTPQPTAAPATVVLSAAASATLAAASASATAADPKADTKAGAEGKASAEVKAGVETNSAQSGESDFARTLWDSIKHKMLVYKPQDLLAKLKALDVGKKLARKGDTHCAKFITDATLEAVAANDTDTILQIASLLREKAGNLEVVNETSRRELRKYIKAHIRQQRTNATTSYDASIRELEEAFKKQEQALRERYLAQKNDMTKAHAALKDTYYVEGDSDVDEEELVFADPSSLAGVTVDKLRGVQTADLIKAQPLKEPRKKSRVSE